MTRAYEKFTISVTPEIDRRRFVVQYSVVNKNTGKPNTKQFFLNFMKCDYTPMEALVKLAVQETLLSLKKSFLFGSGVGDKNSVPVQHVKSLCLIKVKNAMKSQKAYIQLQSRMSGRREIPDDAEMAAKMPTMPVENSGRYGIFNKKPDESARTKLLLGCSFSGKTTFLVNQLNKLPTKKGHQVYDRIIIMTESPNSAPLKKLKPGLGALIFPIYSGKAVLLLKKINEFARNHFNFLVILDDVVSGIRGGVLQKQILTLRNCNISTVILLQHAKLVTPACRSSFHSIYITQLRSEDWLYILKAFILGLVREYFGDGRAEELAEKIKEFMQDQKRVMHFDQVRDKLSLIV